MAKKINILENIEQAGQFNPCPFYWLDSEQKYLGVNEALIKNAGATSYEKDFAGKTPYDIFPKDFADNIVQHHKQVIKTGQPMTAEESVKDMRGNIKHFQAAISPLLDDEGKIIGTYGVSVEITAEKKDAEIRRKKRVFEHLNKIASIIPINIYWFDENNTILGGNELAAKAVGGKFVSNFVGKSLYDCYDKKIADEIVKNLNEVRRTESILSKEEFIKDLTTGEEKYFNVFLAPILDDHDKFIGTIGLSIDITDQKKLEQALIDNEKHKAELREQEKFKKIVDQAANETKSPLAILLILAQQCNGGTKEQMFEKIKAYASSMSMVLYWLDVNNKIIGANKETLAGIGLKKSDSCIGKTAYDLYPYEMADRIAKHNDEVMRTGKVLSQEESIVDISSGKIKYFIAFKAPLFDEKENVVGIVGTSVEITAEKEAKRLAIENAEKNAIIAEHEKFVKVAKQFAHDITGALGNLDNVTSTY